MSTIHFLNVGHGDCTVIEHDSGRVTVIDCNNCDELDQESESEVIHELGIKGMLLFKLWRDRGDSERAALEKAGYSVALTKPIEYLTRILKGRSIFRYIQTHPDMDHMRGISIVDATFKIENLWDTANSKTITAFQPGTDKDDWNTYQALRRGQRTGLTVLNLYRGTTGAFYNRGDATDLGDGLHILSPTPQLVSSANQREKWNELSYVLALRERNRTVIFGGDAETEAWSDMHAALGASLKCDVLKASHHGRNSGFHEDAVKAMKPGLTVVSVGKKQKEHDASDEYRKHSSFVWSTRWKGNIAVRIDPSGVMAAASDRDNQPLSWKVNAA